MARVKAPIHQVDFSGGQVRADIVERLDTDIFARSLKRAENVRVLATGAISNRPGSFFKRELSGTAEDIHEISPQSGVLFGLILNDSSIEIIDASARVVRTFTSVPWTDATGLWVEPRRDVTLIGGDGIRPHALQYDDGDWAFGEFAFAEAPGGAIAQPYWSYASGITIQPSATTGTINVTASAPVFAASDVGERIRYNEREIEITSYISPTLVTGTVIDELPPSVIIYVNSVEGYRVGEAVVGSQSDYTGIIAQIDVSQSYIVVNTISNFEGPFDLEEMVGPTHSSKVLSSAYFALQPSAIWDEPLMSAKRGYPRSASSVSGRLVFADFPGAPDVVAISSSRSFTDFQVGIEDDDAIVRSVGDDSPRILHLVSVGDLLILTDRGCYYVQTRTGQIITPATFSAVAFDERGANSVRPVRVDSGAAFVDASGGRIVIAMLDGNVQLKWRVRPLSDIYGDLIKSPKKLCGSSLSSAEPEKYIFAVNSDGTLAAMSWRDEFDPNSVGMVPWSTAGSYINVSPLFGGHWAIVDRIINGSTVRMLEAFSTSAYLDSCIESESAPTLGVLVTDGGAEIHTEAAEALLVQEGSLLHLAGETVRFWANDKYLGEYLVNADGTVTSPPSVTGARQMGIGFTSTIKPFSRTHTNDRYRGFRQARTIRVGVGILDTVYYSVRRNGITSTFGPYLPFEDDTQSPGRKSRDAWFPVFGDRDKPEIEIIRDQPGPFTLTRITMEVQS